MATMKHLTPSNTSDKRGIPFAPDSAVGQALFLGTDAAGREVYAVPSWERISLHPDYDAAKLETLRSAAESQQHVEVEVRTGKPVGETGFRPRYIRTVRLFGTSV